MERQPHRFLGENAAFSCSHRFPHRWYETRFWSELRSLECALRTRVAMVEACDVVQGSGDKFHERY